MLALNKADLETSWHWNAAELSELKQDFAHCFDTSAKTGQGVEDMFTYMAQILTE